MRRFAFGTSCVFLCLAALATPAQAGFDIDFGTAVRVGDDTDLYLAISSRYFEHDRTVVEGWASRYARPDDLAVALFIGRNTGASLDRIFHMRRGGMSWWSISMRLGMPMDAWFVPVRHDPGPPYGKAYGHWKKHRHAPQRARLTDAQVANLVAVRMIHEYWEVPVEVAMDWRSSGRDLRVLMSVEYKRRYVYGHDHRDYYRASRHDDEDEDEDWGPRRGRRRHER